MSKDPGALYGSAKPPELHRILNTLSHRDLWCIVIRANSNEVLSWTKLKATADWKSRLAKMKPAARAAGWTVLRPYRMSYPNFYGRMNGMMIFVRVTAYYPPDTAPEQELPPPSATLQTCFRAAARAARAAQCAEGLGRVVKTRTGARSAP